MKLILLTQGQTTIVDDDDFARYGHLKWHYSHGRAVRRVGKWTRDKSGVKGTVWLHREIMGNPDGLVVDHINGNALDNRRANLRLCTQRENSANQSKTSRGTTSPYKGVYHSSNPKSVKKFHAYIGSARAGERQHLGSFATELEAAQAYNKAAITKWGEFARLNLPMD
jgi:hypothetical protein